ncbi:PTS sugar transporter subunit IIB [Breznakia pachnodae]|jgi:PTS system cellobiose-specific IIB component|uniref:PTS system cellobiose-specific IIB component n=1 Tax=Breznakia pachnodae TaxID=265178 RepID=A0ABU0E541_9FIRM|nr:hypothetical protein [Breznakia pachnodae]MDQ0361808.1 PTS system cellobiose-specific IIB component [Breznakia pachnodae]
MKALIICQFAITSKNMITKIIKYTEEFKSGIEVECASVSEISELPFENYDIVLLAPQIRNYLSAVSEKCNELDIPVDVIDVVAYGLQDAKKVVSQIENRMNTINS